MCVGVGPCVCVGARVGACVGVGVGACVWVHVYVWGWVHVYVWEWLHMCGCGCMCICVGIRGRWWSRGMFSAMIICIMGFFLFQICYPVWLFIISLNTFDLF